MTNRFLLPSKAIIGMVHFGALPGTPQSHQNIREITQTAVQEAAALERLGCDAIMIENMHDRPHLLRDVGPEIVSAMTAIGVAVRQKIRIPLGVQVLVGANEQALAVAQACEAQFIRADAFVFAHVSNTGMTLKASAGTLLRYRKQIGAEDIAIYADVKKKHSSHTLTADLTIADVAREAEYYGADGIVVTGLATGLPTNPDDVQNVKDAVSCPVLVGSGVTPENLAGLWRQANGFIVGSYFKHNGKWHQELDEGRVEAFMNIVRACRETKDR